MTALFEARGITKRFGRLTASTVDFALDSGIASIIGPNGAGKTALQRLHRALRARRGRRHVPGHPLVGLRPDQITARSACAGRSRTSGSSPT